MFFAGPFANWFRTRKQRPIQNHKGRPPKRFRPILEALEGRITPAVNDPFTFLNGGFTQELVTGGPAHVFPTSSPLPSSFGIVFAPTGDPIEANFGSMWRTDLGTAFVENGSTIHPTTSIQIVSLNGLGITTALDGHIYTTGPAGVFDLDPNTGAVLRGPFGLGGNGIAIATDPQNGNLVYAEGGLGGIAFVNEAFTTSGFYNAGHTATGMAFDPTGNFLFLSEGGGITVLTRTGPTTFGFSQFFTDAVAGTPGGLAFHAGAPLFLVSVNTDGTMTEYHFPGDNFTLPPTETLFASGGFPGPSLGAQVGPDSFLYVSQGGTRFADGTTDAVDGSVVRIGPGFAPVAASNITISPLSDTKPVGSIETMTATVSQTSPIPGPVVGAIVTFTVVSGPDIGEIGSSVTDATGQATFPLVNNGVPGTDFIHAQFTDAQGNQLISENAAITFLAVTPPPIAPVTGIQEGETFTATVGTYQGTGTETATINWGDGTTSPGSIKAAAGYQFNITTHYQAAPFLVPISFVGGGSGFAGFPTGTDTGFITITNAGASTFNGKITEFGKAGTGVNVNFTYDTAALGHGPLLPGQSITMAAGDNGSDQGGFNGEDGATNGILISMHGSVTAGTTVEPVDLAVFDKDVHSGIPRDVHAPPSAEIGAPLLSDSYVLQGGDPTGGDTGPAFETTQVDGHFTFIEIGGPGIFAVRGTHTYAEDSVPGSPYPIVTTISSPTGLTQILLNTADVSQGPLGELDLTVMAGPSIQAVEGQTVISQVATFHDPVSHGGLPDPVTEFLVTIDWGDGSLPDTTGIITIVGTNGDYTVTGAHTYLEETRIDDDRDHDDHDDEGHRDKGRGGKDHDDKDHDGHTGGDMSDHQGHKGSYIITVTVSEPTDPGSAQSVTTSATVSDPNVVANPVELASVAEGSATFTNVVVATFGDPGGVEPNAFDVVTFTSPTGSVQLSFNGAKTSSLVGGATTAAVLQAALGALPGLTNVAVLGPPGGPFNVFFPVGLDAGLLKVVSGPAAITRVGDTGDISKHYSATIDWGDGTSSKGTITLDGPTGVFSVSGSHTYSGDTIGLISHGKDDDDDRSKNKSDKSRDDKSKGESEGTAIITVKITHEDNDPVTVTDSLTITDPALTNVTGGFTLKGVESPDGKIDDKDKSKDKSKDKDKSDDKSSSFIVATFTDPGNPTGKAEDADDYTATIDWGDNTTPTQGTITFDSDKGKDDKRKQRGLAVLTVKGPHNYHEEGSYTITVSIAHELLRPQVVTDTIVVSDPPVKAGDSCSFKAVKGTSLAATVATFTDPGGAEPNAYDPGPISSHYTATIDWGDKTPTTAGTITYSGSPGSAKGVFSVAGTHTYAAKGMYKVKVTIDHEGIKTVVYNTVEVSDPPPPVQAMGGSSFKAGKGKSFSGTLATFTDPGGGQGLQPIQGHGGLGRQDSDHCLHQYLPWQCRQHQGQVFGGRRQTHLHGQRHVHRQGDHPPRWDHDRRMRHGCGVVNNAAVMLITKIGPQGSATQRFLGAFSFKGHLTTSQYSRKHGRSGLEHISRDVRQPSGPSPRMVWVHENSTIPAWYSGSF